MNPTFLGKFYNLFMVYLKFRPKKMIINAKIDSIIGILISICVFRQSLTFGCQNLETLKKGTSWVSNHMGVEALIPL